MPARRALLFFGILGVIAATPAACLGEDDPAKDLATVRTRLREAERRALAVEVMCRSEALRDLNLKVCASSADPKAEIKALETIFKQLVELKTLQRIGMLKTEEKADVEAKYKCLLGKLEKPIDASKNCGKAESSGTPPSIEKPKGASSGGQDPVATAPTLPSSAVPPATATAAAGTSMPAPRAAQTLPAPEADVGSGTGESGPGTTPRGARGGEVLRTIVGFEQSGASAASSDQKYFFDIYYSRPIKWSRKPTLTESERALHFDDDIDLGPRLRTWGDLRISSVPQQISTSVATFTSNFAMNVAALKVNQVAQSFEFLGGIDYRVWQTKNWFESFDQQSRTRVSLSFIVGGGVITPLTPRDSAQLFAVPGNQPEFMKMFNVPATAMAVAFVLPDRDRFFRQAYAGIRLKTHYFEVDSGQISRTRFPATFDIAGGFNESVTGGRVHGAVMRLEGFLPIPYAAASWVYLFGTGLFKPNTKPRISRPFLLDPASMGTSLTAPTTFVIVTPQSDRDYYRIGVGVDFVQLVDKLRACKPGDPSARCQQK